MYSKTAPNRMKKRPHEVDVEDSEALETKAKLKDIKLGHGVQSAEVGTWKVVNHDTSHELYTARVGSCFMPLSIACYDRDKKRVPFTSVPKLVIKLMSSGKLLAQVRNKKVDISPDKSTLKIKEFFINSRELDDIRPNYEATLHISTPDEALSVAFPCRVIPGAPRRISVHPTQVQQQLLPGQIIERLSLEVFDEYGNHVKKDESILLRLDGFSFQDGSGIIRDAGIDCMKKVDDKGYVDLSNVLKVSRGYGEDVVLSVISKDKVIFELRFRTEDAKRLSANELIPRSRSSDILPSQMVDNASQIPGKFSGSAFISPKVRLEKTREENHEDVGSPILSTRRSSPSLKVSQVKNETFSPHRGGSSGSALISLEELEDDLINSAMKETNHFTELEHLNFNRLQMQKEVASLRALIGPSSTCGQQSTLEQIKSTSHSAAAVICKMPEEELRRQDIVGVVALLGTVESIELSRMLAQYLGEDQMLAIVRRSHVASYSSETNILNKFATELGLSINGGYLAICLEDIRPSVDPLQPPTLPNGITPQGFLGYAVNLINIAKSGHGLRETLFYSLFGDLQVYQNRDCMMAAQSCSCIKAGAVSLDGGMIRGNGIIYLGHWEAKILFPVKMSSVSLVNLRRMEKLEERERELVTIKQRIDVEGEALRRASEELVICRDKYNTYKSQKEAILQQQFR